MLNEKLLRSVDLFAEGIEVKLFKAITDLNKFAAIFILTRGGKERERIEEGAMKAHTQGKL